MVKHKKTKNRFKSLPNNKRNKLTVSQIVIIAVISLTLIVSIAGIVIAFFSQPEQITKARISEYASDYYENYLYEKFITSDNFSGDLNTAMEKYKTRGFSSITLRQLILHDLTKTSDYANLLRENCDEEKTTIKFYPEEPYGRNNYRTEYHYVCNF